MKYTSHSPQLPIVISISKRKQKLATGYLHACIWLHLLSSPFSFLCVAVSFPPPLVVVSLFSHPNLETLKKKQGGDFASNFLQSCSTARFHSKECCGVKLTPYYMRNYLLTLFSKGAWVLPLLKCLKPFLNLQPQVTCENK